MTKSQNTKNEQLTEQWKKGELPLGWYYVKYKNDKIEVAENIKWFDCGGWCDNRFLHSKNISGVIAPVPSYDEWKAAQEQLHKEGIWYTEISHKKVLKENAQLKELLEEVKDYLPEFETLMDILAKIDEALR